MKKLTWWFRVVGAFYLLMALMYLFGIFVNPQTLKLPPGSPHPRLAV